MDESDIEGFDIKLYGDCGVCTPNTSSTGRLPGNVTTYTCIGWTPEDQTCRFEVRTVSKDCQLLSILSNYSVILDSKPLLQGVYMCVYICEIHVCMYV